MKKISFCWYFDKAPLVYENWRDGLRAAIELLEKEYEVDWIIGKRLPDYTPDYLLFWDDSNSEVFGKLNQFDCWKGLCLTTAPTNMDNLRKLNVVFCESDPIYDHVKMAGLPAIKAFGTDTDFFTPDQSVSKDIKFFYPATFSPWKRQDLIAHYGSDLLCVGTIQPDGHLIYEKCCDEGVKVEVGYFPAEKIRDYYRRSQSVIIPAVHGSERTVLEAMSCDILPEVINPQNIRAMSYIQEYKQSGLTSPRQFVLERYSHVIYANQIKKGLTWT